MNIMLATVTERTREVGIRRALGGKQRDIVQQFLVEAVVQTTLGGLMGTLLGFVLVFGVPPAASYFFGEKLLAVVRWQPIALAVGVSVLVGVVFGLYPGVAGGQARPHRGAAAHITDTNRPKQRDTTKRMKSG